MYQPIQLKKTTTLPGRNSLSRWPWRRGLRLIGLALACFALSPPVQAVDPPPDGGYPGQNTAEGKDALFSLTSGADNTAIGFEALYSNTTGGLNTANGGSALRNNTSGVNNTANGYQALLSNTTGSWNTADGVEALRSNNGFNNTANGYQALYSNTTGISNTATGFVALLQNTTGRYNTANGGAALYRNTTGVNNTAVGFAALEDNTTGSGNIAVGASAGLNLTTGSNNINIGNRGFVGDSHRIRIGTQGTQTSANIAGIYGATVANGVQVVAGSNGRLGTIVSSARFKEAIKPMDKESEAILALKPVSFRYRQELDPEGIPQFGLVAEEVEKINPALVARDEKGKAYSVRYEAVNAMLLNEFLKEHRKVEEQEATITQLKSTVAQQQKDFQSAVAQQQKEIKALTASVKEQASRIQKVSDELAVSKAAPPLVANNQ